MAYIILSVGAVLFLFWLLAFVFALKTEGERSLFIPVFFSLLFGGLFAWGGILFSNSQEDRLSSEKFLLLKPGMTPDEVSAILGTSEDLTKMDEEQLKSYDLTTNSIQIASTVKTKLSPKVYQADRKDSSSSLTFYGEPSKVIKKLPRDFYGINALGMPASVNSKGEQGDGVKGSVVRIFVLDEDANMDAKEAYFEEKKKAREEAEKKKKDAPYFAPFQPVAVEGKEWLFEEGKNKDWIYPQDKGEDGRSGGNDEDTAKAFAEAFNEKFKDVFKAEIDDYEDPARLIFTPLHEDLIGSNGNKLFIQVASGPSEAIKVGRTTSGAEQRFSGGANSAQLDYFREVDPLLDKDFDTSIRLIVVGYEDGKLVNAGESGIYGYVDPLRIKADSSYVRYKCNETNEVTIPGHKKEIVKNEKRIVKKEAEIVEIKEKMNDPKFEKLSDDDKTKWTFKLKTAEKQLENFKLRIEDLKMLIEESKTNCGIGEVGDSCTKEEPVMLCQSRKGAGLECQSNTCASVALKDESCAELSCASDLRCGPTKVCLKKAEDSE